MTESFWADVLKQGGFALLAMFMAYIIYWLSRERAQDAKEYAASQAAAAQAYASRQAESAQAFMGFGAATATSLTQVAETMRGMTSVLSRIDERLAVNHVCPLSHVITGDTTTGRRATDAVIEAVRTPR